MECPSLSPDGTRLAFKKRLDGADPDDWRLSVLNLKTGEEHPLAETQNVDDQAEWLDNDHVLYAKFPDEGFPDIWSVPADGTGRAEALPRAGRVTSRRHALSASRETAMALASELADVNGATRASAKSLAADRAVRHHRAGG